MKTTIVYVKQFGILRFPPHMPAMFEGPFITLPAIPPSQLSLHKLDESLQVERRLSAG